MITTNESSVIEFILQCQPGFPRSRGQWNVDRTGTPFILPSIGGITLNLGGTKVAFATQADAPSCADCGSIMVRNGSCYKCMNCGSTSGCS